MPGRSLDAGDFKYLRAVLRAGSLKGAARLLGTDHATVGRHIDSMEHAFGAPIFERGPEGVRPLPAAKAIAPLVDEIFSRMDEIHRIAEATTSPELRAVTIAISPILGDYLLLPQLGRLREEFPKFDFAFESGIKRVSVSSNRAEIALRVHPIGTQVGEAHEVARRIGRMGFALYAGSGYVQSRGVPQAPLEDLKGHDLLVAGDKSPGSTFNSGLRHPARIVLRAFPYASLIAAVSANQGLALLPCLAADNSPGLVQVSDVCLLWNTWMVSARTAQKDRHLTALKSGLRKIFEEERSALEGGPRVASQ